MIDIHSHILPAVDDGARDLAEAVEMCRLAARQGCTTILATPHQRHGIWWNNDQRQLEELRDQVAERVNGGIDLRLGAEVRVDSTLLEELHRGDPLRATPLAGSRYVLIEFDFLGEGPDPAETVQALRLAGCRPIISHPEQYPWLVDRPVAVELVLGAGAYLQITAMSLTGDFGPEVRRRCRRLLDADQVHFLASDAHDIRRRPPGLKRAYKEVVEGWGEERAELLTRENPQAVLEDRELAS